MTPDHTCSGLRLLLVGPYPPPFGGIATHLRELTPALKSMKAEGVAVVSFGATDDTQDLDGFKLYRFNLKKQGWRLLNPVGWSVVGRTIRALRSHRLGAVAVIRECLKALIIDRLAATHASNVVSFYVSNASIALLPLSRIWGRQRSIVLTVFGEIYEDPEFMTGHRRLFQEVLAAPAAVTASSCHCGRSFASIGVTRPIEPVYYGVRLEGVVAPDLRSSFRQTHQIRPTDVVVLFMARFLKSMGLDVLLTAAPTLLAANPSLRLVIAGAQGDLSAQAAAFGDSHADRVLVKQDVPFAEQSALYSAADILVAPGFDQRACMGLAIKDAMAAALPVIGGAGGGVSEAVVEGETGFLIALDQSGSVDVDRFVERVLRLAADPDLRKRLGSAGRRRAEDLFGVETTNRRMAEIFMTVMPR